jgi:hypothetical protein
MAESKSWPRTRRPRRERDRARAKRAAAAAHAGARAAIGVAIAQIAAAFNEAAVVNSFKLRVESLIQRGPYHPAARARFQARAAILNGRSLDAAIAAVDVWWREERKAFQIASALGCGTRLSLDVLGELRLILRLVRFKRMDAAYYFALAALCETQAAEAAE